MNSTKLLLSVLCAFLLLTGCELMSPQPPQRDPVLDRLDDLDRRLDALERVLASGSLIDLTVQVDELQRETSDIRGRIETLEHGSASTSDRQRDLYVDLDDRVRQLEMNQQARPALDQAASSAPVGQLPVPGGSDRENYEAAFELLKQQQYVTAGNAFRQFLVTFPNSQLIDNAQYWLAETYYVTASFEEALIQFQRVLSAYPRSRKVPDALLKIGYSNYELGRWDGARAALVKVRDDHADSTAARLAVQRLERMDSENR